MAAARINSVRDQLKVLKASPQVEVIEPLTGPQMAGWIDSDGCLCLTKDGDKSYSLTQKYPQICQAFQRRFPGSHVYTYNTPYGPYAVWSARAWKVQEQVAREVFPYLLEKREQAAIVRASSFETRAKDLARLKQLKGHSKIIMGVVPHVAPSMQPDADD